MQRMKLEDSLSHQLMSIWHIARIHKSLVIEVIPLPVNTDCEEGNIQVVGQVRFQNTSIYIEADQSLH